MSRPGRRTLGAAALCLAVLAVTGVVVVRAVAWHGSVTVLANWTGGNEALFREKVIAGFESEEHIHVLYQGSSAVSQVLAADAEAGTTPDVAVLPGPGELAGYAHQGRLQPLDGLVDTADFAAPWGSRALGPGGTAHTYWVPIKTDLKSLVWHPATMKPAQLADAARQQDSWCLGMADGATSGWPGTDWIEDILLQQAGHDVYQEWATGNLEWTAPAVRRAFRTWGAMVGAGDRHLVGNAMVTGYGDAARGLLPGAARPCTLEHQATFVRTEQPWIVTGPAEAHSHDLVPGAGTETADWEVSGDLAAMFRATPQARKLIAYLARPDVQQRWSRSQHGFTGDRQGAGPGADRIDQDIARVLRDPHTERCYDASDAMPSAMRDAFALAALRYLADPGGLDAQLDILEKVRDRVHSDSASGDTGQVWLLSVCGTG